MTRRERNLRKWVPNIWAYLNCHYFSGLLPKPRFYYTGKLGNYAKDFAGLQWAGPNGQHCMAIDPNSVETRVQALAVVAHEMIHQLQLLQDSERTRREHHSRFFMRHAARLNAAGIPVTVEYHKIRTRSPGLGILA